MSLPTSMNYILDIVKEMSIVTIDKKIKLLFIGMLVMEKLVLLLFAIYYIIV